VPVVLELSPKLLGIHRGLDSLAQVIGRSYTHVVPLRRVRGLRKGRPQFELIPVERFRSVIDAVDDRGERSHTDVLLVDERARARQPVSAS
jgi:hypothetical protein